MHKQHLITRTALISILIVAAVAMSACANLPPPILGGAPATGETASPPGGRSPRRPFHPQQKRHRQATPRMSMPHGKRLPKS